MVSNMSRFDVVVRPGNRPTRFDQLGILVESGVFYLIFRDVSEVY